MEEKFEVCGNCRWPSGVTRQNLLRLPYCMNIRSKRFKMYVEPEDSCERFEADRRKEPQGGRGK